MRSRSQGHSVMELAFFLPFLLFMFVGAFDWGFYNWALISTQNAARVAALYTSTSSATASDSVGACTYALAELADAPNVAGNPAIPGGGTGGASGGSGSGSSGSLGGLSGGSGSGHSGGSGSGGSGTITTCSGPPVTVTATSISGPDGSPASQVTVTYLTPALIPIPGLLTGQISITRVVQMRVKS